LVLNKQRVTIVDVAQRARVSLGTVSQVLNHPEHVGPDRLARVMSAIEELGYTRNLLAQGLRAKRSSAIGLCVPHSRIAFFAALLYRFEELAVAEGMQVMHVLSHETAGRELERIKTLVSYGIDGLLLVPSTRPEAALDYLTASNMPTVVVDRPLQSRDRFDQVVADNRGTMALLVTGLIRLGHRRILLITRHKSITVSLQRAAGLRAALSAASGVQARVIESGDTPEVFRPRLRAELEGFGPTAIIAGNDVIVAWTMRELQVLEVHCPADVSLVVFDEPSWAELVTPPLSTVRLAVEEMTTTAWTMLMERMRDRTAPPRHVVIPAEVKYRGSVAAAGVTHVRSGRR
jgi:LacI family transcriptional regulator